MRKFICCPASMIPSEVEPGVEYFSLFSSLKPRRSRVGDIALYLQKDIRKAGFYPSVMSWDFTIVALSVAAVDDAFLRKKSEDGWTRMIDLTVHVNEPLIWSSQRGNLESTLHFLTGDFWNLTFLSGGEKPPTPKKYQMRKYDADCISLLSGGVDSLVGAIDLTSSGKKPLFISKIVTGDKEIQSRIASELGAVSRHFQWSFSSRPPTESEISTRGRSIIFFAYAALAASAIEENVNGPVKIYVPENGFISLNVALNPARLGSLSTKTTHPIYLRGLQEIWNAVNINAELIFPFEYQFKTKGEILAGCLDKAKLVDLIADSTSCGRYGRKKTHCGRCIPCLVRRAAFLRAGIADNTALSKNTQKKYVDENLKLALSDKNAIDLRAAAVAYLRYKEKGIGQVIGGALSFSSPDLRAQYEGVVARGLDELGELLKVHKVI